MRRSGLSRNGGGFRGARTSLSKKSKRKGAEFERRAASQFEEISGESTRLQVNSGAIRSLPGDVWSPSFLHECKESSKVDARGNKQITIKKEWLEKAAEEAAYLGKPFCLPFQYAGDSEIYCVIHYNDLAELARLANEARKTE